MDTHSLCIVIWGGRFALCGIETSESLTTLTEKGVQILVGACDKHGKGSF